MVRFAKVVFIQNERSIKQILFDRQYLVHLMVINNVTATMSIPLASYLFKVNNKVTIRTSMDLIKVA